MKHQFLLKALFASGLVAASAQLACSAESSDPYPNGGGNRPGTGATGGTPTGAGGDPTGAGGSVGTGGTPTGAGGTPTGAGGTPATGGAPPGGAAGTVGAGGTTGGTGSMTCAPQVGSATDLVISDLEAGTNALNPPRTGYWFSFGMDTGATNLMPPQGSAFAPEANGNEGSAYFAHFTCSGGKYVGMGFAFNDCNMKAYPYDISAYTGISLAYKSSHALRVMLQEVRTTAAAYGGNCTTYCDNPHYTELEPAAAWTTVQLPLSTFIQGYGDPPIPLDKTQVLQLQFQVAGAWNEEAQDTDPITPAAVDIAVDDLKFY